MGEHYSDEIPSYGMRNEKVDTLNSVVGEYKIVIQNSQENKFIVPVHLFAIDSERTQEFICPSFRGEECPACKAISHHYTKSGKIQLPLSRFYKKENAFFEVFVLKSPLAEQSNRKFILKDNSSKIIRKILESSSALFVEITLKFEEVDLGANKKYTTIKFAKGKDFTPVILPGMSITNFKKEYLDSRLFLTMEYIKEKFPRVYRDVFKSELEPKSKYVFGSCMYGFCQGTFSNANEAWEHLSKFFKLYHPYSARCQMLVEEENHYGFRHLLVCKKGFAEDNNLEEKDVREKCEWNNIISYTT